MTKSLGPAECAPTPKAADDEAVVMTKSLETTKSREYYYTRPGSAEMTKCQGAGRESQNPQP